MQHSDPRRWGPTAIHIPPGAAAPGNPSPSAAWAQLLGDEDDIGPPQYIEHYYRSPDTPRPHTSWHPLHHRTVSARVTTSDLHSYDRNSDDEIYVFPEPQLHRVASAGPSPQRNHGLYHRSSRSDIGSIEGLQRRESLESLPETRSVEVGLSLSCHKTRAHILIILKERRITCDVSVTPAFGSLVCPPL